MVDKNLTVGIDEITIILKPTETVENSDWLDSVNLLISFAVKKLDIEPLFGSMVTMEKNLPQGYSDGLTIPNRPYYFAIAWNNNFQQMGICIKFSAYFLATYIYQYKQTYDEQITVVDILKNLQSDNCIARLSRIDFIADYKNFDEKLSPDTIYNNLLSGRYIIQNYNGRKSSKKTSAISKNGKVSTFYAGSRGKNVYSFLRCYDKRLEQIEGNGFRLDEALACKSWTRFEICYRGKYAHQITDDLLSLNNTNQLQKYIAQKITEKYRFYDAYKDCLTDFSEQLIEVMDDTEFSYLRSESPRDNELRKSIMHLLNGSGLFPAIYKAYSVWHEEGEEKLFDYLYNYYHTIYKPNAAKNKELILWIKKHKKELAGHPIDDILSNI